MQFSGSQCPCKFTTVSGLKYSLSLKHGSIAIVIKYAYAYKWASRPNGMKQTASMLVKPYFAKLSDGMQTACREQSLKHSNSGSVSEIRCGTMLVGICQKSFRTINRVLLNVCSYRLHPSAWRFLLFNLLIQTQLGSLSSERTTLVVCQCKSSQNNRSLQVT